MRGVRGVGVEECANFWCCTSKQEATAHYEMEKLQIRGFFGCRGKAE